jgi:hypothetical protein
MLVLTLPQASQAECRTALPRFGVLVTGDVEGFAKAGVRFGWGAGGVRLVLPCLRLALDVSEPGRRLLQPQLPLEAVEFGCGPAFLILLHQRQRRGAHSPPVLRLATLRRALGHRTQPEGDPELCLRGPHRRQPLPYLPESGVSLLPGPRPRGTLDEGPALQANPHAQPPGKPMLVREGLDRLRVGLGLVALAAAQRHVGHRTQRLRQASGMRQGLGEGATVPDALQGLGGGAMIPEDLRGLAQRQSARGLAHLIGQVAVGPGGVEHPNLVTMCLRAGELATKEPGFR